MLDSGILLCVHERALVSDTAVSVTTLYIVISFYRHLRENSKNIKTLFCLNDRSQLARD